MSIARGRDPRCARSAPAPACAAARTGPSTLGWLRCFALALSMKAPSHRWLVAAACIAMLILGFAMLFGKADPQGSAARSLSVADGVRSAPSTRATTPSAGPTHGGEPAGAVPPTAQAPANTGGARGAAAADMRLAFASPVSVRLGESVDVVVTIEPERPLDRVVLDIDYDPRQLRARSAEEVDYSQRPSATEPRFSIESMKRRARHGGAGPRTECRRPIGPGGAGSRRATGGTGHRLGKPQSGGRSRNRCGRPLVVMDSVRSGNPDRDQSVAIASRVARACASQRPTFPDVRYAA